MEHRSDSTDDRAGDEPCPTATDRAEGHSVSGNREVLEEVPLNPTEKVMGVLTLVMVAVTTWGLAGKASWAPGFYTGMAVCMAAVAVLVSRRDEQRFNWKAFLPFVLFGALIGASLLNPSHTLMPGVEGVWFKRHDWRAWLPATVDGDTTLTAMLPWLSALLLGGALRQAGLGRRAVRLLWGALLLHGLVVCAVGTWFYFDNNALVLGLYLDRYGYHFASFIYRNHWAAYVLVLVPMALGFAFSALRRWAAGRGRLDAALPGLGAALLIALTLPMPGSRSGMVAVTLLFVCAFVMMGRVIRQARAIKTGGAAKRLSAIALGVFLAAVIGTGVLLNRDAIRPHWNRTKTQLSRMADGQYDLRWHLSRDTVKMAADRPIWGWGVGCYGIIFPSYQGKDYLRDEKGRVTGKVLHAHNDWAHLWAETGLAGLLILLTPVAWLMRAGWKSRGVLARWGVGAVGLILAYALVEFPLHSPAVLFLWVTVLCTAAPSRDQASSARGALPPART